MKNNKNKRTIINRLFEKELFSTKMGVFGVLSLLAGIGFIIEHIVSVSDKKESLIIGIILILIGPLAIKFRNNNFIF